MPLTQVNQGLLSTDAQYTGFKNRLINGGMVIDQRNAGASVTLTSANGVYAVDRFESYANTDGTVTAQRVTDAPTGFVNSLRHTTTVADSSLSASQRVQVVQKIEGFNVADFGLGTASAATFTVSFWVKSSLTGTFGGSMINGGYTRSYPFSYTINAANTWEQKSVTIAGDTSGTWLTDNQRGLTLCFGLGVGSNFVGTANTWQTGEFLAPAGAVSVVGTLNATWQVTGVQLEKGSTATSFDTRPYGTELQLCQRYYQRIGVLNMQTSASTTTAAFYHFLLPVTPRATPTMTFGNSTWNRMTNFDVVDYSGVYTPAFNDYGEPNILSFVVRVTSGSTWSSNAPLAVNPTTKSQAVVIASMEL